MLFASGKYLVFLAIIFFAYWLIAAGRRARVLFLLIASYYFYALWNPWCLIFLVVISAIDFATAIGIDATRRSLLKKALLTTSLVTDVGSVLSQR